MTSKCKQQQEGDEMACSCGLRWDVHEEDPHGHAKEARGSLLIEEEHRGDSSVAKFEHAAAADSYSSIFSLTGCYNE